VKRFINVIVVAILVIITACHAEKQLRLLPQEQRYENITEKLQARICIDTMQKQSEKGLQFSILIGNDSTGAITINNPMLLFTHSLLDSSGNSMLYKEIPRALIHRAAGNQHHFQTFNVTAIKVNGRSVSDDLANVRQVIVPAKGVYEIFMSITQSKKPKSKSVETIPLPKGHYVLSIALRLIVSDESRSALKFTDISIHYR
jgi:hypothetical protein